VKLKKEQKIMAETNKNANAPVMEETHNQGEAVVLKYKNAIIGAVVALVVVVAGVMLYRNYVSGPAEMKASTALAKGQQLFQAQQFEQALNGDSTGYAGLLNIASEYSSTDAGNLANLYAGLCNAQLGKWEAAAKFLEAYDGVDDAMVSPAAVGALGNAYAHLNQLDKAVTNLKKAAEMADNNSLSPTFLVQAGEILESQGKNDEALKLYQTVKEKYFNSMQSQTIDAYIERVSNK
jgi:tetratricopeptide (TPR) repeat protein